MSVCSDRPRVSVRAAFGVRDTNPSTRVKHPDGQLAMVLTGSSMVPAV